MFGGLVCVDCVMAIANGDTSGVEDFEVWESGVESLDACESGRYTVVIGATDEDSDDAGFSWSPCDYCGSRLGGDRFHATFIENREV